jgi:predicted lipid-binding transport protein (Tim44 family)
MARDRLIGVALVVGAVVGVLIYGFLIFMVAPLLVLEISAFVAVLAILAILGWIGYVMATTPPPVPLEPEPTADATTSGGVSSTNSAIGSAKATVGSGNSPSANLDRNQ